MKENDLICPICGEPTNSYMGNYRKDRLCRKHAQDLKNGAIEQCEDCGAWHEVRKSCECKKHIKNETTTDSSSELTCIICGQPSNGKHFCKSCYHTYKDRSVDIRITHCIDTEILDEYGNLTYKCNDGRKVRSRAEKIISDTLFELQVLSIYEEIVNYYTEDGKIVELHPDFYLPKYEIYIEYNELKNKPYLKNKEHTQKMYTELQKKVVIMTEKDLEDVKKFLKQLLKIN